MNSSIGIWIDHTRAIIVSVSSAGVSVKNLKSGVAGHPHFAGSQVGGGEKKYEARFGHQLARFYDEVIGALGHTEGIMIMGPGEAKRQLQARLTRSKALSGIEIDVQATDELTEPQIVAKVRDRFERTPHQA